MRRRPQDRRTLLVWGVCLASLLVGARLATALDVGQPAPDFTLPSTMGIEISLSEFRGKKLVFIEFYTNDFVPT